MNLLSRINDQGKNTFLKTNGREIDKKKCMVIKFRKLVTFGGVLIISSTISSFEIKKVPYDYVYKNKFI